MANVKASASHNLTCESNAGAVAVVKHAASAGLQCNPELVKGNAGSLKVSHNQHYAGMSDTAGVGSASHSSKCEHTVVDDLHIADNKNFKVRFIYNSGVVPRQIDALLARKHRKSDCNIGVSKSRTVWNSGKGVQNMVPKNVSKNNICTDSVENVSCSKISTQEGLKNNICTDSVDNVLCSKTSIQEGPDKNHFPCFWFQSHIQTEVKVREIFKVTKGDQ